MAFPALFLLVFPVPGRALPSPMVRAFAPFRDVAVTCSSLPPGLLSAPGLPSGHGLLSAPGRALFLAVPAPLPLAAHVLSTNDAHDVAFLALDVPRHRNRLDFSRWVPGSRYHPVSARKRSIIFSMARTGEAFRSTSEIACNTSS